MTCLSAVCIFLWQLNVSSVYNAFLHNLVPVFNDQKIKIAYLPTNSLRESNYLSINAGFCLSIIFSFQECTLNFHQIHRTYQYPCTPQILVLQDLAVKTIQTLSSHHQYHFGAFLSKYVCEFSEQFDDNKSQLKKVISRLYQVRFMLCQG